jgi:hypothetical protein
MEHAVESTKQGEHKSASSNRVSNAVASTQSLHPMLQLQQQTGNQAVQELLRTRVIQAKMSISHPDDPEEREADHVADRIMRAHTGFPIATPCSWEWRRYVRGVPAEANYDQPASFVAGQASTYSARRQ